MRECTVHWYLLWAIVSLMTLHLTSTMPTPETTVPSTTTLGTMSTTTAREHVSPMSESLQHLANQLMQLNATSHITFDTRTPPKLREQMRKDSSHPIIINDYGHPGVAEPVEEEISLLDEENKRMNLNFYKLVKPTTDSGLSTWILLSGQSSTNKPTKKPIVQIKNSTEDKPVKPIFKRKSTTTTTTSTTTIKPALMKKSTAMVTTTLKATIATATVTERPEKSNKVNRTSNTNKAVTNKPITRVTNAKPIKSTKVPSEITSTTSTPSTKAQEFVKVPTKSSNNSNQLQPEAKEGTLDLTTISNDSLKKTKRPTASVNTNTTKRKKNKSKRKKPIAEDKMDKDKENSTKIATKIKEKPIGTQIYNYLSREVMPTVGVGLVGLVVTAGLASYFLYPFGALRRSYEVDRKDKEGNYHYSDEYTGGIAEEEAIGKVIAGMPNNNYYNTRLQNSRNTYGMNYEFVNGVSNPNRGGYQPSYNRFRNVDQRFMEGNVDTLALKPMTTYKKEEIIIGNPKKSAFHNHKDSYENIPVNKDKNEEFLNDKSHLQSPSFYSDTTESATPSIVPEHGPRTLEKLHKEDAVSPSQALVAGLTPEKIFVVESVPAEAEPLYAAMDHGPRRRRKRDNKKDAENEIEDNEIIYKVKKPSSTAKPIATKITTLTTNPINTFFNNESTESTIYDTTTIIAEETTDPSQVGDNDKNHWQKPADKPESIFSLLRDLVYFKIRLGLQLLQEKAQTVSRYIANVQEQMDIQYKNVNHSISATRS